ncbi:MAG: hypothetical protein ABH956_01360 [Candidatus Nealsonbacteria bacterium]
MKNGMVILMDEERTEQEIENLRIKLKREGFCFLIDENGLIFVAFLGCAQITDGAINIFSQFSGVKSVIEINLESNFKRIGESSKRDLARSFLPFETE